MFTGVERGCIGKEWVKVVLMPRHQLRLLLLLLQHSHDLFTIYAETVTQSRAAWSE